MPLERSTEEVAQLALEQLRHDFRKCLIGIVTNVYPSSQTVDVQIATNQLLFDELGNAVSLPAPAISNVPLGCLRGGGFFVWIPVAVGDSVLLVFSDLSADTWRAGDASGPKDPGWCGIHTMDSPFAIPMFAPTSKALGDPAGDASSIIIGKDGTNEQIHVTASDIKLGAGATDFVALASKVSTELMKISTTLGSLSGATFATPYVQGAVAATIAKAK